MIGLRAWWAAAGKRRSQRALQRQAEYQRSVAGHLRNPSTPVGTHKKASVRELLAYIEFPERPRVLEVGSSAKGMLFYLPKGGLRIAVDPLALDYAALSPEESEYVRSCTAFGERLPFRDESFDFVICDNVVDHAEEPASILRELSRVLRKHGTLYFTVNVHHRVYRYAAAAHNLWSALGVHVEIGPFADHTFHFTLRDVRRLLAELPLTVRLERDEIAAARERMQTGHWRLLKRLFYKNARYVMIATKSRGYRDSAR